MDSHSLLGAHIGDVLPPMQHRPLSDLFLPELGAAPAAHQGAGLAAKKGGLKMDKSEAGRRGWKRGRE